MPIWTNNQDLRWIEYKILTASNNSSNNNNSIITVCNNKCNVRLKSENKNTDLFLYIKKYIYYIYIMYSIIYIYFLSIS